MNRYRLLLFLLLFVMNGFYARLSSAELGTAGEEAWNAIRTYQFGDELKPLVLVELEVLRASVSPEGRAKMAAKLASFLNEETTYAGRQFVCLQLRAVGTSAEVPVLTTFLNNPEDADNARMALQNIAGEEALVPLRRALETFQGRLLTGVIESLAERRDVVSIPDLIKLSDSEDQQIAATALAALGAFDDAESVETLMKPRKPALEMTRLNALLRVGHSFLNKGDIANARKIFDALSDSEMPMIFQRAALEGTLRTLPEQIQHTLVYQWFFEDDPSKNAIAASRLQHLPASQFDELFSRTGEMNPRMRLIFLELAAVQHSEKLMAYLRETLETGGETERLSAVRTLGLMGDPDVIPMLIEMLRDEAVQNEVAETLKRFSKDVVERPLIRVLDQADIRLKVLEIMGDLKCYEAIDPLIVMAQSEDPDVFVPVIAALGRICDPDDADIPRMLRLYLASRPGIHRESVERAIVIICEMMPDPDSRADFLIRHLRNQGGELTPSTLVTTLPLLGRVGNARVADLLFPLLTSDQPDTQRAAIRALCNWPNANYKNELWDIAVNSPSQEYSRWALRAYIRVVTLRSERPESETLAMLQNAMGIATDDDDRRLCLNRAASIRTMETVEWVAGFLDDPALAQTACETLAELARHRFLREPNRERFEPILRKVEEISTDSRILESVRRSRLGM